jgi:inosine-uridine nucleoside N-ribohydrolase
MPIKLLLDTDIGSDIDDAVCLAYLLAQPECELLGITTVTGQTVKRAQMASALCRVAGTDLPIYPGAEVPLLVAQRQPHAPQASMLPRWPHASDFPRGQAVEFMRRTIRGHPGEVTLLTIGPLTNVALLFAVDPEIPALLKGLVMMCGVYTDRHPDQPTEWNASCDPHATAIVFRAAVPLHRAVGLDVTLQVAMSAAEIRSCFEAPLLRAVLDFAEVWFADQTSITFHDPLAAATIFDEQICTFERGTVTVDLDREPGRTRFTRQPAGISPTVGTTGDPAAPHQVALAVDPERFFEHYFGVFRS